MSESVRIPEDQSLKATNYGYALRWASTLGGPFIQTEHVLACPSTPLVVLPAKLGFILKSRRPCNEATYYHLYSRTKERGEKKRNMPHARYRLPKLNSKPDT
jgi:hypothetical protein